MLIVLCVVAGGAVFVLSREEATVPIAEGYGPNPTLPEFNPTWLDRPWSGGSFLLIVADDDLEIVYVASSPYGAVNRQTKAELLGKT